MRDDAPQGSCARKVLVAGIGNIFLGDDRFGVEVVRRLPERPLPEGVRVIDFGIRGFDLAMALREGYETAILVDAIHRGSAPGFLHVFELTPEDLGASTARDLFVEAHALDPVKVLRLARALGGPLPRVVVVGCEPATVEENCAMQLSEPVAAAVDQAIARIEALVAEALMATSGKRGL